MTHSLRALLDGILDYAGLFPPAKLTLDEALRRFAADRAGPDAWMLSRFVIPASRLHELGPYHDAFFPPGARFPFSILARGGSDADSFLAGLDRDLADLGLFLERHETGVAVDLCEMKLPLPVLEPPDEDALVELLDRAAALIDERSPAPLALFFEGTYGPDWHRSLAMVVAALARHHERHGKGGKGSPAGLKLRCGGTESTAFPPVEQVAFVLAECRDARVPFKATAGLHFPVRHLDHEVLAKVHGFLNVFGGATLAHARGLDEQTLGELVADEDPQAFRFEGGTFRWRDQSASVDEIRDARRELACSFGSCSFDDPRRALRGIGLM